MNYLESPKPVRSEDTCERAAAVVITCASGCGFYFLAADVGIYSRRDKQQEICVDNQAEFISQARLHHEEYAGVGAVFDAKTGQWRSLTDHSHNIFTVEANLNGFSITCLPIIVR